MEAMKSRTFALFALLSLLSTVLGGSMVQAKVLEPSTPLNEPVQSSLLGRSLLVEEVTATWCPSCADIDPYLLGVADAHGSRIAMVAYHPSDGEDAFQPPAAQHRIDRLGLIHGTSIPTPTFMVEGENPRSGFEAWNDVQRDILDAEVLRQDTTSLQFELQQIGNTTSARVVSYASSHEQPQQTQLTFMVVQHDKLVPKGAINPGGATRDRVVVATAECVLNTSMIGVQHGLTSAHVQQGCTEDFSISFDNLEQFSVLLVHESTVEAVSQGEASLGSPGVVELAVRNRENPEANPSTTVLLVLAAGAGIAAILPRKGTKEEKQ